jgi:uncharacterized phage-like protein YoqJ
MSFIIAGTGHRPSKLGGYGKDIHSDLVNLASDWLVENKPTKVISGMALGWDQALAEAAIAYDIKTIAAIPFKGQESIWPPQSIKLYNDILKKCSSVHIVSTGTYSAQKLQIRNQWMVDHCTHILALWDGTSGGTGNCIKYAMTKNRPIDNLWNKWSNIRAMAEDIPF